MVDAYPAVLSTPANLAREQQLRDLMRELDISEFHLNVVQLHNAWQPYHNWGHCVIVALNAVEAADLLHQSKAEKRLLILAAIYHDFNHTGDASQADVFNIARAVKGMREWVKLKEKWVTQSDLNEIAEMIYATETRHHGAADAMKDRILVDADILATDVEDAEGWYAALSEETGQQIDAASTWRFIRVTEPRTLWGIHRSNDYLERLRQKLYPEGLHGGTHGS